MDITYRNSKTKKQGVIRADQIIGTDKGEWKMADGTTRETLQVFTKKLAPARSFRRLISMPTKNGGTEWVEPTE